MKKYLVTKEFKARIGEYRGKIFKEGCYTTEEYLKKTYGGVIKNLIGWKIKEVSTEEIEKDKLDEINLFKIKEKKSPKQKSKKVHPEVDSYFKNQKVKEQIVYAIWKTNDWVSFKEIVKLSNGKDSTISSVITRLSQSNLLDKKKIGVEVHYKLNPSLQKEYDEKIVLLFEGVQERIRRQQEQEETFDIIEKSQEFIELYCHDTVLENIRKGKSYIKINFTDIIKFNPDYADYILDSPDEAQDAFRIAIDQLDTKKKTRILLPQNNQPQNRQSKNSTHQKKTHRQTHLHRRNHQY